MTKNIQEMKSAAAHYASYYGDMRRHLSTEFAAEVKWLTASLFALNAGGLATLLNAKLSQADKILPAIFFWFGTLCAFAFVSYSLRKTKNFAATISSLEEQYVLASVTGNLDQENISILEDNKNRLSTKLSAVFSIGSFSAFTIALIAIGCTQ